MLGRFVRNLLKLMIAVLAVGALMLPIARPAHALGNVVKAIYVGSEYYAPTQAWQDTARSSGYTTLCLFTMHVQPNGDLDYNATPLVTNGVYVGDPTWGAKLAACKAAPSSVNRIELTISGWGDLSFTNIKNLIAAQGTGPDSILYRSFRALKNATGIDAIQYDDEGTYDLESAVAFGNMISGLGMKVSFCPFTRQSFWVNAKSQLGSKVDAIYLQCYDGGARNDPAKWINAFGGFKVYPGLWGNKETPSSVTMKMRDWQTRLGITGGFMWLNGTMQYDYKLWSAQLHAGLDPVPFFILVNQKSGKALDLINGNTANGAVTNQWTYDYNRGSQRWALLPTENGDHFKIISWVTGKCLCPSQNSTRIGAQMVQWDYTGNNPAQQWDLIPAGNGWYNIRNVQNGLRLDVSYLSTADNSTVWQWSPNTSAAQRWRLQPWGNYFVRADSGKYICVQGAGSTNGNLIIQHDQENNPWFKWQFTGEGDGFYGLFSLNAPGRALGVKNGSYVAGSNTYLWDYNPNNRGDQEIQFIPKTNGKFKFYFKHNGMSWDIPGGATGNNVNLQQYPNNGNSWQLFDLERDQ